MSAPVIDSRVDRALVAAAEDALRRAAAAGADHAEVCVESSRAFTVRVQNGQIDSLKHSGTRGLGLRVFVGGAEGFVSSTDLRPDSLDDLARRAVALARFSTPDEFNGVPSPAEAGEPVADLELFDPAVLEMPAERKIALALDLERIALAHDPRVTRSDSAGVSTHDGQFLVANSAGLVRGYSGTSVSAYVVALADDRDGRQQSGGYGVSKRWLGELPSAEKIGAEAARRAVSRLGARQVPTARVPVVMHPDIASAWIAEIYGALSGESLLKKSSWLTGRLGEQIGSPLVTLVDDGALPRGYGSSPVDGEGFATRRNVLIDRGRCAMFAYDAYHARRARTHSTGNGVRGYSSTPGVGYHNLYLERGTESPEAILARVERGFYMDDQGSYGFNDVTGDYSFQAQGHWIENGVKVFPVEGVTVASNSLDMLRHVAAVGDDLEFDGSVASPTLLISEMTVSGS
jgi:PmbA protein